MTAQWLAFWDTPHPIYVNARHKDIHYRRIAQEIATLVASPQARVLDYGSGEALHAELIAAVAREVLLCEGAPRLRAGLATRFADNDRIRAVAPEDLAREPDHSLDLIVLHSVAQYLSAEELTALLGVFRRLLRPDGTLLVSDVIPPQTGAFAAAGALLRFGAADGFLGAAFLGLVRARLSPYWRVRKRDGLSRYSEDAMMEKLATAGFAARRVARNPGHDQARMAFLARPR
jgi:SAM-dependent methyltransferase